MWIRISFRVRAARREAVSGNRRRRVGVPLYGQRSADRSRVGLTLRRTDNTIAVGVCSRPRTHALTADVNVLAVRERGIHPDFRGARDVHADRSLLPVDLDHGLSGGSAVVRRREVRLQESVLGHRWPGSESQGAERDGRGEEKSFSLFQRPPMNRRAGVCARSPADLPSGAWHRCPPGCRSNHAPCRVITGR